MTKYVNAADLIEFLQKYPADTPIFDGNGWNMHWSSINEMKYDDWTYAQFDEEGREIAATGIGISIGRRY